VTSPKIEVMKERGEMIGLSDLKVKSGRTGEGADLISKVRKAR
jgi:hypothetical protein